MISKSGYGMNSILFFGKIYIPVYRAPWYFVERKRAFPDLPLPNANWLRKDFETCVETNDRECRYIPGAKKDGFGDHRRQTMFFCGQKFTILGGAQGKKLSATTPSIRSKKLKCCCFGGYYNWFCVQ